MSDRRGHRPGYLVVRTDDGAYHGGLMVTDGDGLPVDFRYTDPVTPTRLQRALYGGVLDRYLRGHLLLGTLLDALEQRPSLLLVDDRDLLDEASDDIPFVHVEQTGVDPIGEQGSQRDDGDGGVLIQTGASRTPLRVIAGPAEAQADVVEAIASIAERIDVLEPAERVRNALDVIVSEGGDA